MRDPEARYTPFGLPGGVFRLTRRARGVLQWRMEPADELSAALAAETSDPADAGLLLRIAHAYRHRMSDVAQAEEKRRMGRLAVDYAHRAAALAPEDPAALLAVALAYGKLAPWEDNRRKLELAGFIKRAVDDALRLDPGSDLAWHVLGRWQMGLAELTGVRRALAERAHGGPLPVTTHEAAAGSFERAQALRPDRLAHCIELGRAWARSGRTEEARRMIARGLEMPETERDDAEAKRVGREELAGMR